MLQSNPKTERDELLCKRQILENARDTLKSEFVGIDNVIDSVIDSTSSWYFFPELQDKPVIINLWGLTGVGKSSLVNRLAQLLDFQRRFYQFNLGEKENSINDIRENLYKAHRDTTGFPMILALDEFQNARTIDESGKEVNSLRNRIIWQLLDSGRINTLRPGYLRPSMIYSHILALSKALELGVKVKNGKVIARYEYFKKLIGEEDNEEEGNNSERWFITRELQFVIMELYQDKYSNPIDLEAKLREMSANQSLKFLEEVYLLSRSTREIDCSKSLIFVLGNLDEAYRMSGNFSPDMDADDFHKQSLEINIPQIKSCLQRRFRNEQIARLGNNHVIYPSLDKSAFERIIDKELAKLREVFFEKTSVRLEFRMNIRKLIYREGVYPTQGIRPLLSTIYQVVRTRLGDILAEIKMNYPEARYVEFNAEAEKIIAILRNGLTVHNTMEWKYEKPLEKIRSGYSDDEKAIISVHEAGHTTLATILLDTIPRIVNSGSAEANSGGFVYVKFDEKYISKNRLIGRIAYFLGGYAAEKLVFGEDYLTNGAEKDINKATEFVLHMIKDCGLGPFSAAYGPKDGIYKYQVFDHEGKLDSCAEELIREGLDLAEKTLQRQEVLLLRIAQKLIAQRELRSEQIRELVEEYAHEYDFERLNNEHASKFYNSCLKRKLNLLERIPEENQNGHLNGLINISNS